MHQHHLHCMMNLALSSTRIPTILERGRWSHFELPMLVACWTPLGGRTVVRGVHLFFLRVVKLSGDVWSYFPVKSDEENSLSAISFEVWTSLGPFPLPLLLRWRLQFRGRPGLWGVTVFGESPVSACTPLIAGGGWGKGVGKEENCSPRWGWWGRVCGGWAGWGSCFSDTLSVPAHNLVLLWCRDSDPEQLGKSSFFNCFRPFPDRLGGATQPTEDVEPRNLLSQSHRDKALQSHSQGLSLRRRYSKALSMARHSPDSSVRELLNRYSVVRRFRSWKARRSTHCSWLWCSSSRSRACSPLKVFWCRLHRRFPWRNKWLRLCRSTKMSSWRYSKWLSFRDKEEKAKLYKYYKTQMHNI